jgi:hypothetical protein
MSWEYRLIASEDSNGAKIIGLHEIYRMDENEPSYISAWSENPVSLVWDDHVNINMDFRLMMKALKKPILRVVIEGTREVLMEIPNE